MQRINKVMEAMEEERMETEFDSASQVGPGWKSNQAGMPGAVPVSSMDLYQVTAANDHTEAEEMADH